MTSEKPSLEAPLIDQKSMLAEDPFYGYRDELRSRVEAAQDRFDKWKHFLENTNTARNAAFKDENIKLKQEVSQLLTNVQELEEVVYRIETNRSNFPHIDDDE